ncbi:hypothetical protein RUM43_001593 [Polyplax serrata]|uniref:Uncharacterized protein n=1 Tax=Polyplax serrata TaxID=468196 RepID=A0AAN8SEK1_POLSC
MWDIKMSSAELKAVDSMKVIRPETMLGAWGPVVETFKRGKKDNFCGNSGTAAATTTTTEAAAAGGEEKS